MRAITAYAVSAIFLYIAARVYALFSHGVSSDAMRYSFVYPLVGGALYLVFACVKRLPYPRRACAQSLACGLTTLAVGAFVRGVMEIFGTTSDYTVYYPVAGALLLCAGVLLYSWRIAFAFKSGRR